MRTLLRISLRALNASFMIVATMPALAQQPNVVLIMVDDMAYHELGVTGQNDRAANGMAAIETPNIDELAQQGLMLTEFYATPICGSTRGSLLTGYHNGHSSIDRNGGNQGGNPLRDVDKTFAQTLKAAGYTTGAFGKWGVGGFDQTLTGGGVDNINTAAITHPDATPASKGFDEFYGYLNQLHAHNYYVNFLWEHDTDNSGDIGGMQIAPTSTADYSHDLIANRSLQFIADHADESGQNPFLLYLPYTIPHGDFNPPNDAIRQTYVDAGYSSAQADYAAMMKRMDNSVGHMIDRLKDPDGNGDQSDSVYDNTLILFASDNGGTAQNSLFNGGGNLRGQKGSVYEGGIKSPFIAHWNGTIAPGQVDNDTISGLDDLYATLSDLAGADHDVGLDGTSIAGLFTGQAREKRDIFIFEGNGTAWSIRMGNWKMVNGTELYNLMNDPSESSNVAGANPAIANLMHQIALDEGVLSDIGSGAVQTTHIVQYKTWLPQGGSQDWQTASNWAGGSEFNSRGTAANNFNTAPANNWVATVDNTTAAELEAVVDDDSSLLALDVRGSSAPMKIRVAPGAALMARNGAVIGSGATLENDGGTLHTLRSIRVEEGGTLAGNGEITTSYDTSGTSFRLKADLVNTGIVDIFPSNGGVTQVELIANGGFEMGTQSDGNANYKFVELNAWGSDGDEAALDAAVANNARTGGYRGLIASRVDSPHNLLQNTGHVISSGDELALSFWHRAFSGWDEGVDDVVARVFYLDDSQQRQVLQTIVVSPSSAWASQVITLNPISDPNAAGRELWIEIDAASGDAVTSNEFASLDDVSLTVTVAAPPRPAIMAVAGDYIQTDAGRLLVDLMGGGGNPGVDFDRLDVSGDATLGGVLEVRLDGGYQPAAGTVFTVVEAGQRTGGFDSVELPALAGGLTFSVDYSATAVTLTVAGVLGDYNQNGVVDLADYTVWRDALGQTGEGLVADGDFSGIVDMGDYQVWKDNFGVTASNANLLTAPIPEPATAVLLIMHGGLVLVPSKYCRAATLSATRLGHDK